MVDSDTDAAIVLAGSPDAVVGWCRAQTLLPAPAATAFAGLLTLPAATELVVAAEPLIHRLVLVYRSIGFAHEQMASSALHFEFPAVVASPWFGSTERYGYDVALGLTARFRHLVIESSTPAGGPHVEFMQPPTRADWAPLPSAAVTYVATAVLDRYQSEQGSDDYALKLERILSILGLRPGELATALRVSRQGLRKWEMGGPIALERRPRVDDLYDFAQWISKQLQPQTVPAFMRRRIAALGYQTPLEWLMADRLQEFRSIYRRTESYDTMP